MERLGIVRELTAQKRNRLFSYAGSVEIMNRGTELPGVKCYSIENGYSPTKVGSNHRPLNGTARKIDT